MQYSQSGCHSVTRGLGDPYSDFVYLVQYVLFIVRSSAEWKIFIELDCFILFFGMRVLLGFISLDDFI